MSQSLKSKKIRKCRCMRKHRTRYKCYRLGYGYRPFGVVYDVNIELMLLKLWCLKNNFDGALYQQLTEDHKIHSIQALQSQNRIFILTLISQIPWDSYQRPSKIEFLAALDRVDREIPHYQQYSYSHSHSYRQKNRKKGKTMKRSLNKCLMTRSAAMPKSGMKMKQKKKMKSSKSSSMKMDSRAPKLGFKVGGATDIVSFRQHIKSKKFPKLDDVNYEGIFNDYYFDTESNEKGTDFKQDEEDNTLLQSEGDVESEEEQEPDQHLQDEDKQLFYPSYCYAKSRKPYALWCAESIEPDIKNKEDENKTDDGIKKKTKVGKDVLIESMVTMIEEDIDDITFNINDREIAKREIFMTVGLNSNISEKDFSRKKLNLVILLDISGSMNAAFDLKPGYNRWGYNNESKLVIALKSIIALLSHLKCDDRFGFVLFNKEARIYYELNYVASYSMAQLRAILSVHANGGTNFEAGYKTCIDLFRGLFKRIKNKPSKFEYFEKYPDIDKNHPIYHMEQQKKQQKEEEEEVYITMDANANANVYHTQSGFVHQTQGDEMKEDEDKQEEKELINDEYENRIIVLTDLCPNKGKSGSKELMKMVKKYAIKKGEKIYTTFIGVGLDFNTKLVDKICNVRGANYFAVHDNKEFVKRLDAEFDYMVSPMVFNLKLTMKSEGNMASIDKVYGDGSGDDKLKNGEIMNIVSLFPSPPNEDGDIKGGIVLLKLKQNDSGDDAQKSFNMIIECKYEDKYGKQYENKQIVEFGQENKMNDDDYFDNLGVQKGILLTRYVSLLKHWIKHDRYQYFADKFKSKNLKICVSNKYKKIFQSFLKQYFEPQMKQLQDKDLKQEVDILNKLINKKTKL